MQKSVGSEPSGTFRETFTPKLVIALRQGYGTDKFAADLLAGLTVAVLALPLSMAIAIGAGATPGQGLVTSVVAGFLISALGGSRFQIGGPATAFIVIIATLVQRHGFEGLATATFLAGLILILAGLLRLGTYIKYVPGPVILGFTSGIGILILLGQIKDLLGLSGNVPPEVLAEIEALWNNLGTYNPAALTIGLATLAGIIGLKHFAPRLPGLLIAVVAASLAVFANGLPVETIGTRFGGIPASLPAPALPDLSWHRITEVLPSAFTIAFLVGVESLLSAVAADTIAGSRHRSNMEIVAQGVANVASPLFGGLPATGVIARTGTNIAAGAATPVSGILHAAFVLVFMLLAAPLASYLALPCLAAVLVSVAWRLIDPQALLHFIRSAPADDLLILAATLLLTVLVDLNVAIAVGVVLASMLFMHRMAEAQAVRVGSGHLAVDDDLADVRKPRSEIMTMALPEGVRVLEFRGPLFFGAAQRVSDAMARLESWPKVVILRMRDVPLVDSTAIGALNELAETCRRRGCRIILSGLRAQPRAALHRSGFPRRHRAIVASNSYIALEKAKDMISTGERPAGGG
jgi:SulP family sulfate permease